MKTLISFLLGVCLLATLPVQAAPVSRTEPTITSIRGRIVRISVPEGYDHVTLQQYFVPRRIVRAQRESPWRTIATKYPRGRRTVITLRLPTLVSKRYLRVFGNKLEPLPGSLLTGITRFMPDPVEADQTLSFNNGTDVAGTANNVTPGVATGGDSAARTVEESDIWKVNGDRLYFFNELRGLQVFDLSKPAAPALLGTLRLPGSGEEMYLLGNEHAVLLKRSSGFFGLIESFSPVSVTAGSNLTLASGILRPVRASIESGEIIVADVGGGAPILVARVPYEGTLAESRMVGSVLYLATNIYRAATDANAAEYGLQITSFDLADPASPVQRDAIFLGGWANTVTATDRFFLVAKYADYDGSAWNNSIDLIDISAPDGAMKRAGQAKVQGNISSKFNMDIDGDVLTAVAQNWGAVEVGNPDDLVFRSMSFTKLQTFSIADPSAPVPLGGVVMAPGETVRATRFDAGRAYVVTFRQIDPLFVVDLKDPVNPAISGHIEVPGFSTYIEPLGDRLVTIGLLNGQPAVALFDVADSAAPKLLSQVALGSNTGGWAYSEAVWNEKAFKVLPDDNLILVPVSGSAIMDGGWSSRVQLLDLFRDKIVKRGAIEHAFSPRRATLVNGCVVAISPTRLVTVNADDRDHPVVKADLEIAWSVNRVFNVGRHLVQLGGSADWSDRRAPVLSVSTTDDANARLATIHLANVPVLGATVKGDVLYIAQGSIGDGEIAASAIGANPLTVSAYDLANLPALRLLGAASARTTIEYGDLSPLWPSPGILVWAGSGGGSTWSGRVWSDPQPAAAAGGDQAIDLRGHWSERWYYTQSTRLVAFDFTRPQTPAFLSSIKAGGGKPWDVSDPVGANGMIFFSYKFLGPLSAEGGADATPPDPANEPPSPRTNRHYLLRVDYADPAAPVIDDAGINLPGRLSGIARAGKLLFTTGQDYDFATGLPKPGASALQVSAFDGTAAHLLDTLPLASPYEPVSIQGETIFALDGQPAWLWNWGPFLPMQAGLAAADLSLNRFWGGGTQTENPKKSVLSAWRLDEAGKFNKLGEIEAAHDTSLFVFGGLVVTQGDGRTLHLFDASNPATLGNLGEFRFDGWVWPDLNHANGGLDAGLSVPLSVYGVEIIAIPAPVR